MRVQTFWLLMALFGVIAFCCVQETARQARLQYRLAVALRQEEEVRRRLEDLRAEETRLLNAARLLRLNAARDRPFAPLRPWPGFAGAGGAGRGGGAVRTASR